MLTRFAFDSVTHYARNARGFRALARDYRECAAQGLSPAQNMRNARRCEANARIAESLVRHFADSLIAQGVAQ